MEKVKLLFVIVIWLSACQLVSAETRESEFALFKRTISPVYKFGENGIILVPKATTQGKWNFYGGVNAQDAGKIEDDSLYLTAASIMVGTSDDVEIGYTSRQFIWDDFDKSDINMDTFHIKARIFHLTDNFIPQVAFGVNAVSINSNEFNADKDILFNPYLSATIQVPLLGETLLLSFTAAIESIYNEGSSGEAFYSCGADLRLFKSIYLFIEAQGFNKEDEDEIFNVGAKYKFWWVSLGITVFNAGGNDISTGAEGFIADKSNVMAHLTVEVPLGKKFINE